MRGRTAEVMPLPKPVRSSRQEMPEAGKCRQPGKTGIVFWTHQVVVRRMAQCRSPFFVEKRIFGGKIESMLLGTIKNPPTFNILDIGLSDLEVPGICIYIIQ